MERSGDGRHTKTWDEVSELARSRAPYGRMVGEILDDATLWTGLGDNCPLLQPPVPIGSFAGRVSRCLFDRRFVGCCRPSGWSLCVGLLVAVSITGNGFGRSFLPCLLSSAFPFWRAAIQSLVLLLLNYYSALL